MRLTASRNIAVIGGTATPSLPTSSTWLQKWARGLVFRQLSKLQYGLLTLCEDGLATTFGNKAETSQAGLPNVKLYIHDPQFYGEIVFGGSIGAGEAYMLGYWRTEDLTGLVRLMVLNQEAMDSLEQSWSWLVKPLLRVFHWLNRNSKAGSRRNISAHYDLGNDLFEAFLDPTMMYSCALFNAPGMTLEEASIAKLEHICSKLQLQPNDHVLEIGTGWGGFALHVARHYGCRVTTTTISRNQYALAKAKIHEAGLDERVNVLLCDYRDLLGQYDKIVSIEMIEAVGHAYYDAFFSTCSKLLKSEGLMLLQAITIRDQRYESAKQSIDFIQRYIFPGSCIPSNTALLESTTRSSDLKLIHLEDIGPHYARTLAAWRQNFLANLDRISALGYSETFIRMWEFYLCYCEGGFEERALGDVQMLLAKPGNRYMT